MKLGEETIIHPLLMPDIINFYPSLCSIANKTESQDAANQPIIIWVDDPLLRGINCYVQPTTGAETRTRMQIIEMNQWLIGLNGFFPNIQVEDQATIDEVVYNILRVAHDDHETATYLTCEIVS